MKSDIISFGSPYREETVTYGRVRHSTHFDKMPEGIEVQPVNIYTTEGAKIVTIKFQTHYGTTFNKQDNKVKVEVNNKEELYLVDGGYHLNIKVNGGTIELCDENLKIQDLCINNGHTLTIDNHPSQFNFYCTPEIKGLNSAGLIEMFYTNLSDNNSIIFKSSNEDDNVDVPDDTPEDLRKEFKSIVDICLSSSSMFLRATEKGSYNLINLFKKEIFIKDAVKFIKSCEKIKEVFLKPESLEQNSYEELINKINSQLKSDEVIISLDELCEIKNVLFDIYHQDQDMVNQFIRQNNLINGESINKLTNENYFTLRLISKSLEGSFFEYMPQDIKNYIQYLTENDPTITGETSESNDQFDLS